MSTVTKEKSGNVTTTTTKSSYKIGDTELSYRPITTARPVLHISRSGGGMGGGRSMSSNMRVSASASVPSGAFLKMTGMGSEQVKGQRVKEKKDLQDLNTRLADYIEKVRFLEAQNRKLAMELEALRSKWGKETTAIKAMYETELATAKALLDDSEKERSTLDIRMQSITDDLGEKIARLEEYVKMHAADQETIERQNQQMSDYEAELGLLRRRVAQLEKDYNRDKQELKRLHGDLQRARQDLDNETLARVCSENDKQSLQEELDFLKQIHEQEMKELAALAYRDTTAENREYWKSELSQAIHDIQQEYDIKLDQMRIDLDSYYDAKLNEFGAGQTRSSMETAHAKEEVKKLRSQVADLRAKLADFESKNAHLEKMYNELLREYEEKQRAWELEKSEMEGELANLRAELESVLIELQHLFDAKLSLELEIAAYRKLLEGEETRTELKNAVDDMIDGRHLSRAGGAGSGSGSGSGSGGGMMGGMGGMKGEMSAKTTYQRSAKGNVSISECSADGRFIVLENTGKKDEGLDSWKISRLIDNRTKVNFTLPSSCKLGTGSRSKLKIWARNAAKQGEKLDGDLEGNDKSWGIGANISTSLQNDVGEERATHIQKTIYS